MMTAGNGAVRAAPVSIVASDGTPLAGTLFQPAGPPRHAVLLAGALGVPQRFYNPFATWLAAQGHLVLTFDLRGMGASRQAQHRRSLRGLDVDMLGWARLDFAAAVQHLGQVSGRVSSQAAGQAAGRGAGRPPVTVLGHSLGAHHAGMTDVATQQHIGRLVSVAAGAGHWRDWAPPSRRRAPLMLHLAVPLLTASFGYFPGKRLGMVGDLPAGVARQWARWCRHPGFAWGAEPALVAPQMAAARFPIVAFSFTDDEAMTEACTRTLLAAFSNAPSTLQVVSPASVGLAAIGHLGAFRPPMQVPLWPLLNQALG